MTKILRSSFWILSSRFLIQLVQFSVTIILARLLTPSDFGLVAMVTVIRGFLNIFLTTGFTMALVQKQHITDEHRQTIFSLTFFIGTVLFLLSWMGAPFAAKFFNNQDIIILLRVSVIVFLIGPFSSIQVTMLTRQMAFLTLSKIHLFGAVVSFSTTLIMAFNGYGAISMVIGPLLSNFAILPAYYKYYPWFPKFIFKPYVIKETFGFSWKVFATNTVEYFSRNLDNTLIGKYIGAKALGFYNLSYNLMMLPLENIAFPIRSVLLPAFSKIQDNKQEASSVYTEFLGLVSAVVFPAMFGLFIVADLFIISAYGAKWMPAIPILKILCLSGLLQAISIPNNSFLLSKGKSGTVLYLSIFSLIFYAIGFIAGLPWGLIGVAFGYTIANVIVVPVSFLAVNKIMSIRVEQMIKAFISPLVGSFIMSLFLLYFIHPILSYTGITNKLIMLIIMCLSGMFTYGLYSKWFLADEWRAIINSFKKE